MRAWVLPLVVLASLLVAAYTVFAPHSEAGMPIEWGREGAVPTTLDAPRNACDPSSPLAVELGAPERVEGYVVVPLFLVNVGDEPVRAMVPDWRVEPYRVLDGGKLLPLATQHVAVEYVDGYQGEWLEPGARMDLGHPSNIDPRDGGQALLVVFAGRACGQGTISL